MARKKTQPEQESALFADKKPRKRRKPQEEKPEARVVETPPAPEGTGYVMPPERAQAIEEWLNSEQDPCAVCGVPLLVREGRILTKQGLAHKACAKSLKTFEFPPLVKLFHKHRVLWLDRGYDMFKAGYYIDKLYQCGPGNIYGHFGSFGLDEVAELERLGIELVQIWTRHEAYQISMADLKEQGSVQQTPPGPRWLVDLDHFERAEAKG